MVLILLMPSSACPQGAREKKKSLLVLIPLLCCKALGQEVGFSKATKVEPAQPTKMGKQMAQLRMKSIWGLTGIYQGHRGIEKVEAISLLVFRQY